MKIETGALTPQSMEKAAAAKPGASRELTAALEDFEAMFAATLLRTAREENGTSWLGGESSPGGDGIMDFAEQNIAKAMARQDAFGIAKTLSKSLNR